MKKIIFFTVILGCLQTSAQVGINTSNSNNATVLDIVSNSKGILIPRLSASERNVSLADNDSSTTPPNGVANLSLTTGTLIYNTTDNRFEFWDGVLWRQLFVPTSSAAGNDGIVKINSGAGGVKPNINLTPNGNSYGTPQQILYTIPLVFASSPTTSWPETTIPFPGITSNIYIGTNASTQRWRENEIYGQVHIWRLIATVTSNSNSSGSLKATLKNPNSGFEINSISLLPSGSSGLPKVLTFYFYTIADGESLAPNRGYQLFIESDMTCTFLVESFTRISLFKD